MLTIDCQIFSVKLFRKCTQTNTIVIKFKAFKIVCVIGNIQNGYIVHHQIEFTCTMGEKLVLLFKLSTVSVKISRWLMAAPYHKSIVQAEGRSGFGKINGKPFRLTAQSGPTATDRQCLT